MAGFNLNDVPDLSGKVVLITGANSGLGLETAKMVAGKGARVIMACRNAQKAQDAASLIRDEAPNAALDIRQIDLSDLESVNAFADGVLASESKIDLLINNAGVFASRKSETAQGNELQFGTNHLGHFVMNAKLLPLVEATEGGRIVVLGSMSHNMVKAYDTSDVNWNARPYDAMQAYAQSKLANMLYLRELNKRLQAAGSKTKAVMAHPGYSATNITESPDASSNAFMGLITKLGGLLVAQSAKAGALPTVMAATDAAAQGGEYYGPKGMGGMRGVPQIVQPGKIAQDDANAKALWDLSEEMTGVKFAI